MKNVNINILRCPEFENPELSLVSRNREPKSPQARRDLNRIKRRIEANSGMLKQITNQFVKYIGENITLESLMFLAKSLEEKANIEIDRLAKRRRAALICWYVENWDIIRPLLKSERFMEKFRKNFNLTKSAKSITEVKSEPINNYLDPSNLSLLLNSNDYPVYY